MKIKTSSFLASTGVILLIVITLFALALANILFTKIQNIQKNNDILISLASELRKTSQGLTENVRLYVTTADPDFKEAYYEIAAIRAGLKPRPNTALVAPSEKIPLLDLLQQFGIAKDEFALLEEANRLSHTLMLQEHKAIHTIETHSDNIIRDEGEVPTTPQLQEALYLIFSKEYRTEVHKIMDSIDAFTQKLKQRTNQAFETAQKQFALEIAVALICLICTLFVAIFTFFFIHRRIVAPLEETTHFAQKTAEGNLNNQINITHMDEMGVLRQSLNTLIKTLNSINPLTGLYSLHKFIAEARTFIDNNANKDLCIVTFDIDHFSYINEVFGFEVGSQVLQKVAFHIKTLLKSSFPIAHYDGDTFSVITFKESKKPEEVIKVLKLNELRITLEPILGNHALLSLSIGIYEITDKSLDVTFMLDCAHIACHKSKSTFGTHVEFYTEAMKQESISQNHMLNLIQIALEEKEFELFYQPKFDIDHMHIVGAEALIRWFKDGKMIAPDNFIPIAEKNGLISELDYHVIELACQFISTHRQDALPHISINISGFTIIKKELVDKLIEITQKYNVNPQELDLEITETALVHNFDRAIAQILELRKLGFTISMDDFGTGVSSLNRLSQMPLDTIKLDRVFIINALENVKSSVIVQTVIDLAKKIGAKTVAEGIETEEQLALLRKLSCEHGQGYFYARPMPHRKFLDYLQNQRETSYEN